MILGGGRETKESEIDLSVGILLHKKVGDHVQKADSLATIYANDEKKAEEARKRYLQACTFSNVAPERKPLIKDIIR